MESDRLRLNLTLLDIDLVTTEDDRDTLANTDEVTVPVWNVLVSDPSGNIKHNDPALTVDIVSVSQTTELLLTLSGKKEIKFSLMIQIQDK